jgi:hypothetical protein
MFFCWLIGTAPGSSIQLMGCELLRKDHAAYKAFTSVIEGGLSSVVRAEWNRDASTNYMTRAAGIPVTTRPITNDEEKSLYRLLEPRFRRGDNKWETVDFEGMAEAWCDLRLSSKITNSPTLTYNGHCFNSEDIYLKDSGDLKRHAQAAFDAKSTALAKGGSKKARLEHDARADSLRMPAAPGPDAVALDHSSQKLSQAELTISSARLAPRSTPLSTSWTSTYPDSESKKGAEREKEAGCPSCGAKTKHFSGCIILAACMHGADERYNEETKKTDSDATGNQVI